MAETNTQNSGSEEKTPSNECTDCPKETCLEFTVVDFWGDPVNPPSQYTLNGKPASPDTPVTPLKAGEHTLKAVDGEEQAKAAMQRPYEPKGASPSPANKKADAEKRIYRKAEKDQLWNGVPLRAGCLNPTQPPCECLKHLVELDGGIDYCIVIAFIDNHSGGLHGTGHAGALIIDGKSRAGTYTDFGPYFHTTVTKRRPIGRGSYQEYTEVLELGEVNIEPLEEDILLDASLKLDELTLGKAFSYLNKEHGSGIISKKACGAGFGANGPDHENSGWVYSKAGFMVNGIAAWAAYALPCGAYKRMLTYAQQKNKEMRVLQGQNKSGYGNSFNCMTYAISVLDKGLGYERDPGEPWNIDHPNAHIVEYMRQAHEAGFFDDRIFQGLPEAVSNRPQTAIPGLRQRQSVKWVRSFKNEIMP